MSDMKTVKITATLRVDAFSAEDSFLVPSVWSAIELGLKERGVSNTQVKKIRIQYMKR
ncbi:MAG TPA: hypothetical protein VEP90_03740 [Methylomirabilota bacterium]|nr:hypothetical protein [Methylomirabilota bacterium]